MPVQIPSANKSLARLCSSSVLLGVLVLLAGMGAQAPASGAGQEAVLQRLVRAARDVRTIQSDFVQTKRLQMLQAEVASQGRMYLEKPGRLRWEYLQPSEQGFVVDGTRAVRWDEFSREPQQFAIAEDPAAEVVAGQLLAWASVDLEKLRKSFSIEVEQAEPAVLSLRPHGERLGQYLQRIRISFGPEGRVVRKVEIVEQDGDGTELVFENVKLNEPLPEDAFRF